MLKQIRPTEPQFFEKMKDLAKNFSEKLAVGEKPIIGTK